MADESVATRLGESAARMRKERGIKVTELARMVGVSPSLISQIERGQSQPSVSTLFGLASALGVPVDAFMDRGGDPQAPPPPRAAAPDRYLVRRDQRASVDIEGGVRWERLTPETLRDVEFMELVYAAGAQSNHDLYHHPGNELVLVLSGTLHIDIGFETYELEAGDSMQFPSSRPHRYRNPSDEETRAVTVILHTVENLV